MNMILKINLVTIFFILISSMLFSCKKGEQSPIQKGDSIIIERVTNPDEPLKALLKLVPATDWNKFQDKNSEINSTDYYGICLTIGARSANALLNVFLGDTKKAEKLARVIKNSAEKLNIKSPSVEVAVKNLNKDINSLESKDKEMKIRLSLNYLKGTIEETLKNMGNQDYAVLIEFGAWVESMRQVSGIIKNNYTIKTSNLLYRAEEAKYFRKIFTEQNNNNKNDIFQEIIKQSSEIQKKLILEKDMSIKYDSINAIFMMTSDFCKKYIR